jgi:hypothetical protein
VEGAGAEEWADSVVDCICEKMFVAMGAGDVQRAFQVCTHATFNHFNTFTLKQFNILTF